MTHTCILWHPRILLRKEISVLLARSALPVHSICAAIQSIGVVRRDVEEDADYKIGWAILPAVILHGSFDFVLLLLAFSQYIFSDDADTPYATMPPETNTDEWIGLLEDDDVTAQQQEQQPESIAVAETGQQELLSFGIAAAITMVGVLYYVDEARRQRKRLQTLEMISALVPSTEELTFT